MPTSVQDPWSAAKKRMDVPHQRSIAPGAAEIRSIAKAPFSSILLLVACVGTSLAAARAMRCILGFPPSGTPETHENLPVIRVSPEEGGDENELVSVPNC